MWLAGALSVLLTLGFWMCWSRWPRRLARPEGSAAEAAFRRHPAARGRYASADDRASLAGAPVSEEWSAPRGPDDDPDFLGELDRIIRGGQEPGSQG